MVSIALSRLFHYFPCSSFRITKMFKNTSTGIFFCEIKYILNIVVEEVITVDHESIEFSNESGIRSFFVLFIADKRPPSLIVFVTHKALCPLSPYRRRLLEPEINVTSTTLFKENTGLYFKFINIGTS